VALGLSRPGCPLKVTSDGRQSRGAICRLAHSWPGSVGPSLGNSSGQRSIRRVIDASVPARVNPRPIGGRTRCADRCAGGGDSSEVARPGTNRTAVTSPGHPPPIVSTGVQTRGVRASHGCRPDGPSPAETACRSLLARGRRPRLDRSQQRGSNEPSGRSPRSTTGLVLPILT